MKLYSMTGTCALSVNIALEWLGQPYDLELMPRGDNRKPAYLAVNPRGKVPTVALDNGVVLTEAAAILTWLLDAHPASGLGATSDQPFERFAIAEALSYLTGDVHLAFGPFFGPARYLDDETQFGALKKKSLEQVADHMSALDQLLDDHPYLLPTGRSVADAYLYVLARWADYLPGGIRPYPKLAGFRIRMEADPAVQRALRMQKLEPVGG